MVAFQIITNDSQSFLVYSSLSITSYPVNISDTYLIPIIFLWFVIKETNLIIIQFVFHSFPYPIHILRFSSHEHSEERPSCHHNSRHRLQPRQFWHILQNDWALRRGISQEGRSAHRSRRSGDHKEPVRPQLCPLPTKVLRNGMFFVLNAWVVCIHPYRAYWIHVHREISSIITLGNRKHRFPQSS